MQQLQAEVRVFLTFLVGGLSAAVATVNNETFRIVASILLAALAAVGVVPPHIPTTTSIPENEEVNVVRENDGYGAVELLLVVFLALVILVVLFRLI